MNKRFLAVMAVMLGGAALMLTASSYYMGKFGSARGLVVNAVTGEPVRDAEIYLFAEFKNGRKVMPLTLSNKTGAEGRFVMRMTVGGNYRMSVRHPEFEEWVREGVEIEAESKNDLGVVELTPLNP